MQQQQHILDRQEENQLMDGMNRECESGQMLTIEDRETRSNFEYDENEEYTQ